MNWLDAALRHGILFLYPELGRGMNRENRAHAVSELTGKALCGSSVTIWAIDSGPAAPSCRRCLTRLRQRAKRDDS